MNGSIKLEVEQVPEAGWPGADETLATCQAPGLPAAHPAEADLFTRQARTPGHHQQALENARLLLVGAGGLNSWAALGLVRSGARCLTILDDDLIDRTNLPRQLFYPADLGKGKGASLARNLVPHATNRAEISGLNLRLEDAVAAFPLAADLLVVGVDRNDCRLFAARLARRMKIPAVFTMLSSDGMRVNCFLQGAEAGDACLWCALPNLDPQNSMPCAASVISSCMLASAYTLYFVFRALMGWPAGVAPFNWRDADLQGAVPPAAGWVRRRPGCPVCGEEHT
jgi:molybdopterin/thiamine biosynthesis adenylyltransferase